MLRVAFRQRDGTGGTEQGTEVHTVAYLADAQPRRGQVHPAFRPVEVQKQHQLARFGITAVIQSKIDLRAGDDVDQSIGIVKVDVGKVDVCLEVKGKIPLQAAVDLHAEADVFDKSLDHLRDLRILPRFALVHRQHQAAGDFHGDLLEDVEIKVAIFLLDQAEVLLFKADAQLADIDIEIVVFVIGDLCADGKAVLQFDFERGGQVRQCVAQTVDVQEVHHTRQAVAHQADHDAVAREVYAVQKTEIRKSGIVLRRRDLLVASAGATELALGAIAVRGVQTVGASTTARQGSHADAELGYVETGQASIRRKIGEAACIHVEVQPFVVQSGKQSVIAQKLDLGGKLGAVRKVDVGADPCVEVAAEVFADVEVERGVGKQVADAGIFEVFTQCFHQVGEVIAHVGEGVGKVHVELRVDLVHLGNVAVDGAGARRHAFGQDRPLDQGSGDLRNVEVQIGVLITERAFRGVKRHPGADLYAVFGAEVNFAGSVKVQHGVGVLPFDQKSHRGGKQPVRKKHGDLIPDVEAAEHTAYDLNDLLAGKVGGSRRGHRGSTLGLRRDRAGKQVFQPDAIHKARDGGAVLTDGNARRIHEDGALTADVLAVPNGQKTVGFGHVGSGRAGLFVNVDGKLDVGKFQLDVGAAQVFRNADGIKDDVCVHLDIQAAGQGLLDAKEAGQLPDHAAEGVAEVDGLQAAGIAPQADLRRNGHGGKLLQRGITRTVKAILGHVEGGSITDGQAIHRDDQISIFGKFCVDVKIDAKATGQKTEFHADLPDGDIRAGQRGVDAVVDGSKQVKLVLRRLEGGGKFLFPGGFKLQVVGQLRVQLRQSGLRRGELTLQAIHKIQRSVVPRICQACLDGCLFRSLCGDLALRRGDVCVDGLQGLVLGLVVDHFVKIILGVTRQTFDDAEQHRPIQRDRDGPATGRTPFQRLDQRDHQREDVQLGVRPAVARLGYVLVGAVLYDVAERLLIGAARSKGVDDKRAHLLTGGAVSLRRAEDGSKRLHDHAL